MAFDHDLVMKTAVGNDALEARWVAANEMEALDVNLSTCQLLPCQYGFC